MEGFQDFIAGWISGFLERLINKTIMWALGLTALIIGHPFDTIKVRQQVLHAPLFKSIGITFKYEGIRGFYKGMLLPACMIGPSNAVFFGGYGSCMRFLSKDGQKTRVQLDNPNWKRDVFLAGCVAGVVQVIVTCPAEVVKTTLQMQTENKTMWKAEHETTAKGTVDCMRIILQKRGFLWFYRGITPMMWRDVPTSGIYTLTYEQLVNLHYPYVEIMNRSALLRQIFAGGMAGVLSWVVVIPVDVIKSRMQGDNMENPRYRGMIHCCSVMYKEYGWRYFFKGAWPVVVRSFPFNATIFVTYENTMALFHSYS